MKLELKHLAPYLPYKLKYVNYSSIYCYGMEKPLIGLITANNLMGFVDDRVSSKPILRPLSDLTKKIDHNGEKFVPVDNLLCNPGFNWRHEIIHLCSYQNVSKLLEWHFDVFDLHSKNLCIYYDELK